MLKLIALIEHEYKSLKAELQIHQNLFWMLMISGISLPLVCPVDEVSRMAPLFIMIYLPGAIFAICSNIFKADLEDGSMEFALMTNDPLNIVLAKFFNICLFCLVAVSLCMPLFGLLFDMTFANLFTLFYCNCLVSFQASAICLLASTLQNYFQKTQGLLSTMLIPLLIPQIIICGIVIEQQQSAVMMMALGILIITSTLAILFSRLLLKIQYSAR
jgi:heme exporter protein B